MCHHISKAVLTQNFRTLLEECPGAARVRNVAGAHYGPFVRSWSNKNQAVNLGQCFGCINPEFFAPGYQDSMSHLVQYLRNMDPVSTEILAL
jgi:muramidase (phage lysozyme)